VGALFDLKPKEVIWTYSPSVGVLDFFILGESLLLSLNYNLIGVLFFYLLNEFRLSVSADFSLSLWCLT